MTGNKTKDGVERDRQGPKDSASDGEGPEKGEGEKKRGMDGCSAGCLNAFLIIGCLAFGVPLAMATGKAQLDEYTSAPLLSGEALSQLAPGDAVRLNGTLFEDHPVLRPEGFIAVRHYTKRIMGEGNGDHRFVERDEEESERPALRLLADGAAVHIAPDYYIVDSATIATDGRSNDYLRILQIGLNNGESVGVYGIRSANGDETRLDDARIISGDAEAFVRYYTAQIFPFYQIGLGLLALAGLLSVPLLWRIVWGSVALLRFFRSNEAPARPEV